MTELGSACMSVLCSGHVCVHMHVKINLKYFPLTDALVSGFSGAILHRTDLRAHFCWVYMRMSDRHAGVSTQHQTLNYDII